MGASRDKCASRLALVSWRQEVELLECSVLWRVKSWARGTKLGVSRLSGSILRVGKLSVARLLLRHSKLMGAGRRRSLLRRRWLITGRHICQR
jgi:hypothetical protein